MITLEESVPVPAFAKQNLNKHIFAVSAELKLADCINLFIGRLQISIKKLLCGVKSCIKK
ncbi:hypothetical protein BpHYR1_007192 [Brachionus plicatilis]|uniref:Uncharacterized protein n=1 Tax=Brachionus plicatilis TaxID=10195 RepID=A0A3M7QXL8_BRAPC|nr:hypothetical protein BpHYR1_007192 [Brachionus plicatilis]